jgi:hypothetical protein
MCESWWVEVQRLARDEGAKTRVIELSILSDGKLGIWVLSGGTTRVICCAKVVSSTGLAGRRIQEVLTEARKSMGVQGRYAMPCVKRVKSYVLVIVRPPNTEPLDVSHSTRETASSVRSLATPEDLDTPETAEFTEDIV